MDPLKVDAFLSRKCPNIFHGIEHTNDIWLPDPFDVATVHEEARDTFFRMVEQAREGHVVSGRILVIRGEAGAGKTHLMRAFRNQVHQDSSAFFAYMQMTTSSTNYERYILQNVINSLQQPYRVGQTKTSLQVLSDRLANLVPKKRVEALRNSVSGDDATPIVHELADRLVDRNDLPQVDQDLLRALLFLQLGKQSITTKVNKYLRAEPLSDYDRVTLGGIAPLHEDDAPLNHVKNLASLIRTPLNRAFVICMDQLEDIFNLDAAKERFPRAMAAVASIAELPSVVVVVSCLEAFYVEMKQHLTQSIVHRLEQDPEPQTLSGMRTIDEAKTIIARRLDRLWGEADLPPSEETIDPFPANFLELVQGQHSRAILLACQQHRERCIQRGKLVPPSVGSDPPSVSPVIDTTELSQRWNDLLAAPQLVPDEEKAQRDLLLRILPLVADDFRGARLPSVAAGEKDNYLTFEAPWTPKLHIAVTEARSPGGGLLRQMTAVAKASAGATAVLVRSDVFARSAGTQTFRELGKITAAGGRGVIVSDAQWRALVAFGAFHREHADQPGYAEFRHEHKPLWSLKAIQEILGGDTIDTVALDQVPPKQPPTPSSTPPSASPPQPSRFAVASTSEAVAAPASPAAEESTSSAPDLELAGPLVIGATQGLRASSVTLSAGEMRRHAAFLGSTGSGKTTAATMVIEQLLARKIPAILVDRKGDLCGYGLADVWSDPIDDVDRRTLRDHLRDIVDVRVYTPGDSRGCNLTVPLVPSDLRDFDEVDRTAAADNAGNGIAAMMGYGASQTHKGGTVLIQKAIDYLAELGASPSLDAIIELLSQPEESFCGVVGASLLKFCERTVTDLEILKASKSSLLGGKGEALDIDRLLKPRSDGRVPLSIISTKFLSSDSDVQFWVAQLLTQLGRWLDKNPSNELQGVVMLDEADLYLPATRNPVSKQPVENLLRRARSKGFGVFLATQSPGDLDYKCRDNIVTWLVGLVSQSTALKKLEPMFRGSHFDINRLASQKVGEFHLLREGQVKAIRTRRNAVPLPSQVADEQILGLAKASG